MLIHVTTFLILCFLIAPISLLFHEIGHAVGAKLMNASMIQLTIGTGKKIWEGSIHNIHITIRKFFLINCFTSSMRKEPFRKYEKLIISLLGPGFSGIFALAFFVMYHVYPANIIYLSFLFNIWLLVINMLPLKIGQKKSDGYTIYKLLF